jgi:acylphosphatase
MSGYERVQVVITGYVQGVGYRFFAVRQARQFDVKGWVRNRDDGAVEVVAEGAAGMVQEFVVALRRGPSAADVQSVKVTPETYRGEFQEFTVAY